MDIKMMHEMIEKLTEVAKCELSKGVEEIDTEEFGKAIDMIKDLAEAMYYRTITVAMDDAEYGVDYDWEGRKGYRGQPRDAMGRYTIRRSGGMRMGYEEPPYWHITPDMYHDWDGMTEAERMRDMDKDTLHRMYYTEPVIMTTGSMHDATGRRDSREGRSGMMRKGYMEAKEMGKEKGDKMKSLEEYMKSMAEDLTEAIEGASPEERAMAKQKLSVLVSKM